MAPESVDLLVIGAGPAGTAAAITAAGAGRRVVLADRATFPRDKTCGDGLTTEALRVLEELGVPLSGLGRSVAVAEVVLLSPAHREIHLPLPADGQHARVMRRADLDHALVERARAVGVDVREGCELTGLVSAPDHVHAVFADGTEVSAPFAIAADGRYSLARRLLSPHDVADRREWSAFRQYFTGVDDPRLWVLFERDLLPGYAWVFPLPDGRANVGFGMLRGPQVTGKVLAQRWRELLARPALRDVLGPRAEPEAPHRAWPIPSAFAAERLTSGRVLFAGDAAGVVDPMTGEGIAQALATGRWAAEAALDLSPHAAPSISGSRRPPVTATPQVVTGRYRATVTRSLGRDLRFAAALQRLLASPRATEAALRIVDLDDWTRRNFARWMFEDYPRAILFTPRRWRRGMLTPPGAYTER
ncbi:MAG: geranylgeranyl reductase family protein [Acidimicrobiia bacterium]